jgi:diguanylate cyclase (GGDEF)-like protein
VEKFSLFDHIPVGACVLQKDLKIVFWNRCLEEWTKIPRSQILQTSLTDNFPHLAAPKYIRRLQLVFEGGQHILFSSQLHKYLIPCLNTDGQMRSQDTTATPLPWEDGNFYALLCIQDVSALTRSIQEFKSMRDRALDEVEERERAEIATQQKTSELEQRNSELMQLNRLSELLQVCRNMTEAHQVIASVLGEVFAQTSGGIYEFDRGVGLMEQAIAWGENLLPKSFLPEDCWAMRRLRINYGDRNSHLHCQHYVLPVSEAYCIPLIANGENLGLLLLATQKTGKLMVGDLMITAVAEQIALTLANIKLREKMQIQSVRDALTGLYNRRHLDEVLERQVRLAHHSNEALGVIIIDVDRFKQINDSFGHLVGDIVLQELGRLILEQTRPSDIACRYGGEEVVLLLPGANLEATARRAERLRETFKQIPKISQVVGVQTISLGVSAFPTHGSSGEQLLLAADKALYQAKTLGRDRYQLATNFHP